MPNFKVVISSEWRFARGMRYGKFTSLLILSPSCSLPQTLDHLDAASTGDTSSLNFLESYIATLPSGLKRPPPIYPPPPPKSLDRPKHPLDCLPLERSLLKTRPYANPPLAGPRRVPILASTQGIPFLRITKPQPPSLSRIIRARLQQNNKGFEDRVLLENYHAPLARQEDEWDEILLRDHGVTEGGKQDQVKWMDALEVAMGINRSLWDRAWLKRKEVAAQMLAIVDREMELARQEGTEVMRGRKKNSKQNRRVAT